MELPRKLGATAVAGALLVLAAAAFWLVFPNPSPAAPDPVLDVERRAQRAAMDRIEAQSRGAPALPPAQAPPAKRQSPAAVVEPDAPLPPAGYAFVPGPAQMAKAPLPGVIGAQPSAIPNGDLEWLGAADAIGALARQAKASGRDWAFGWLRLAEGATAAELAAGVGALGGEVLGAAGNLVRAKLPGNRAELRAINALPAVGGMGARPSERKIETLREEPRGGPATAQTPVLVTLMADDPDGRWRRALENAGATVGAFHADVRAYPAIVHQRDLAAIAALDVVLAIDPVRVGYGALDRAAMAMGADKLRTYDEGAGLFTGIGGAPIAVGVMDSGLNIDHDDIGTNRESICGVNLLATHDSDPQEDDADLWRDAGDHGTHVTGILLGNGSGDPRYAGMAPLVRHIRFAKTLHHGTGAGATAGFMRAMDWLARATSCPEADDPDSPAKPLIVNMSLSASGRQWRGREVDQRKLDAVVWNHRQLYVVAQDNTRDEAFSNYAAAKNSLAVGAVANDGELAAFSSFGPTADGRLAPQVVATGLRMFSAKGDGSRDGRIVFSGTSMASPTTAGVAALLMEAAPAHREQPALARARLMASAIKPDAWLDSPQRFPASNTAGPGALQHQFGLGKVSARTSVLQRDQADGWTSGSAVAELEAGEYAYHDIVVPSGASRLDVAMTWDEPAADAIGAAVLNDLDLYLDAGADCGSGACGEHSSTSRKDNVEWLVVRDPAPGTYRVKVIGKRIYTAAPRAAVAWTVIRGDSTPTLQVRSSSSALTGEGASPLTLTVASNGYVAAGVRLSIACRNSDGAGSCETGTFFEDLQVQREDGVSVADLDAGRYQGLTSVDSVPVPGDNYLALPLPLGEIAAGEEREVRLSVSYPANEPARLYVQVDAWNAIGASTTVELRRSGSTAADAAPAANRAFARAETLRGESGQRTTDLLLARTEPAEPLFREPVNRLDDSVDRPTKSAWFAWTPPSDGFYRFGVARRDAIREHEVRVDIFHGERIADSRRLGSARWGADALFQAGRRYRIRVSAERGAVPITLRWDAATRPANDDFAAAEAIAGASGSFAGTTWGATLERGEWLGPLVASTWHRWTAPSDGIWEFSTTDGELAAFRGETVSDLRLVSGKPSSALTLPVGAGLEYRIAALAADATLGAGPYQLDWKRFDGRFPDNPNDLFANAEEMGESESGSYEVYADVDGTVEPGEPPETGARTRWWSWRAPNDGRVTWRLDPLGYGFAAAAFAGAAVDGLALLAASDDDRIGTLAEFAFDARAGERYWIGTGLQPDDALGETIANGTLEWAPTPANDGLGMAAAIVAASGSASGDNRWATVEGNETRRHGGSSVWWNFDAPATGRYRFAVTGTNQTVAIYRRTGDGVGGLALVGAGGSEVAFDAVAGARYAVRVGSLGRGGPFTLRWSQESSSSHVDGHFVALFPAAATERDRVDDQELVEGFVRVVNRSAESGTVRITGHDDAGAAGLDTVTLAIGANERRHFNSGDLENGNAGKGLSGSLGDGQGDWRLTLATDLDVDVFVYARTKPGGFLTSLHDIAPCTANRCRVAVFNPGSNVRQRSLLRLVNPGDEAAAVTITGTDDAGQSPGTAVRLQLAPRTATTLTSQDLEGGGREALSGALGDGVGKWELVVEADPAIHVMSLLKSPTGHLTNLSSTRGQ